jgi:hypothetical protein
VLIVCKSQSSAGHGSGTPAIFELQTSGSFNHYPFTDGNIYVGPLSATRYLNGTVSGATAGIYDPHVAIATAKSGTQRFYVNGILRGSGAAVETPAISNAGTAGFGEFGSLYLAVFFDYVLSDSEIKSYSSNPWQVFAPLEAFSFPQPAAGGGTTITGAIGTAVASGLTGTVNANRTISGALGTATATGFLGVVNANRTISGAFGTAVASGLAGNVYANRTIAGALGTATASGFQGAVTNGNTTTITGSLGTAVATGFTGGVAWNRYIAGLLGVATASGFTGGVANGASSGGDGGEIKKPNKFYIRRRKQILIFDSVAQVDAYIAAEEEAAEAIAKAKSRGAKKRIAARVLKDVDKPGEVISIGALERVIDAQQLPFDMVALLKQQDYQRIAQIQREIEQMLDEEEELLLLLA